MNTTEILAAIETIMNGASASNLGQNTRLLGTIDPVVSALRKLPVAEAVAVANARGYTRVRTRPQAVREIERLLTEFVGSAIRISVY